jgi:lysyl-tRNA synthetase class I
MELELMCCDTDWSAHIHEHHRPENSDVMKLFFERKCPCGKHVSIGQHRVDEIRPFLEGLGRQLGTDIEIEYLTDLEGDQEYMESLREVLNNMDELDSIFGGGFRRRYDSPVVNVCQSCGFSYSKGAGYSERTDELVFACRNPDCKEGFAAGNLSERIGVYYLVDPIRDLSRDITVHVFGGDYRDAPKEMKTPKIKKVAKITELANGQTPDYFLTPLIVDEEGKPLSKSKSTGKTVSDIEDLEQYGRKIVGKVTEWIQQGEKQYLNQEELK